MGFRNDYTDWTWFDYRLHFDRSNEPEGEDAFNTALRFEAAGVTFENARFAGFPPPHRNPDGRIYGGRVGFDLLRNVINFSSDVLVDKADIIDRVEELIGDGMGATEALSWAELDPEIGVERIRELHSAGDVDPTALREMLWREMWGFEYALNVHRNGVDIELARELGHSEQVPNAHQKRVSDYVEEHTFYTM